MQKKPKKKIWENCFYFWKKIIKNYEKKGNLPMKLILIFSDADWLSSNNDEGTSPFFARTKIIKNQKILFQN